MYSVVEIYHNLLIPLLIAICIAASVGSDIVLLQTFLGMSPGSMWMQASWKGSEGGAG